MKKLKNFLINFDFFSKKNLNNFFIQNFDSSFLAEEIHEIQQSSHLSALHHQQDLRAGVFEAERYRRLPERRPGKDLRRKTGKIRASHQKHHEQGRPTNPSPARRELSQVLRFNQATSLKTDQIAFRR